MLKENKLSSFCVGDIRHIHTEFPVCINENESINEVLKSGISGKHCRNIYVLNSRQELTGVIRIKDMLRNLFPLMALSEGLNLNVKNVPVMRATSARDIMSKSPACVKESTLLNQAMLLLLRENLLELPVVDDAGLIIGQLDASEIIAFSLTSED
jgi:signal-transduction protein with cAMP-binding, CBS, and nucleotidyltransferase domain